MLPGLAVKFSDKIGSDAGPTANFRRSFDAAIEPEEASHAKNTDRADYFKLGGPDKETNVRIRSAAPDPHADDAVVPPHESGASGQAPVLHSREYLSPLLWSSAFRSSPEHVEQLQSVAELLEEKSEAVVRVLSRLRHKEEDSGIERERADDS